MVLYTPLTSPQLPVFRLADSPTWSLETSQLSYLPHFKKLSSRSTNLLQLWWGCLWSQDPTVTFCLSQHYFKHNIQNLCHCSMSLVMVREGKGMGQYFATYYTRGGKAIELLKVIHKTWNWILNHWLLLLVLIVWVGIWLCGAPLQRSSRDQEGRT